MATTPLISNSSSARRNRASAKSRVSAWTMILASRESCRGAGRKASFGVAQMVVVELHACYRSIVTYAGTR